MRKKNLKTRMGNIIHTVIKRLFFVFLMFVTLSMNAQDNVVLQFMGIPVDGKKSKMISELKKKGFKYDDSNDCLTGRFNGGEVRIRVVDYKDQVYRVLVEDAYYSDEASIRGKYNRLIEQFERNGRYSSFIDNEKIDSEENIHYEISVNNKRYQASFYQKSENEIDCNTFDDAEYSEEMFDLIHNFCVEQAKGVSEDFYNNQYLKDIQNKDKIQIFEYDKIYLKSFLFSLQYAINYKRTVWFMISEYDYKKYKILLYYDNGYNEPNGEDL